MEGSDFCQDDVLPSQRSNSEQLQSILSQLGAVIQNLEACNAGTDELVVQAGAILRDSVVPRLMSDTAMEADLTALAKWCRQGSRREKMLYILEQDSQLFPPDIGNEAYLHVLDLVANRTDAAHAGRWNHVTSSAAAMRSIRRPVAIESVVCDILRLRDEKCIPPLTLMESIEARYQHESRKASSRRSFARSQLSDTAVKGFLKEAKGWVPPCPFTPSAKIALCVRDNWDRMVFVKFQKREKGESVDSYMLNCVTGENMPIPATMTPYAAPELPQWPFENKVDIPKLLPANRILDATLSEVWKALHEGLVSFSDILERPHTTEDKAGGRGKTHYSHAKVILSCSTASYADNRKLIKNARDAWPEVTKLLIACDQQTFCRLWWLKFKTPEAYNDICPWAGDFHGLMHFNDAVFQLNWECILEPMLLYLGAKGVGKKMLAKDHARRQYWLLIILAGGLQWLKLWAPEDILHNPIALLKFTKNNTPVASMIGFLFYFALPSYKYRQATQTSDTQFLDFIWQYALYVYGATGKRNYKTMCLQMLKLLFDSEPNVRSVLKNMRTCTQSGRACTGIGWDLLNEKVRGYTFIFILTCMCSLDKP